MSDRYEKIPQTGSAARVQVRSEMQIGDPAVSASLETQRAEEALLSFATETVEDELAAGFVTAEKRWEAAELAFADAVPTTAAGVMAKLNALHELLDDGSGETPSLEQRHVAALISYFKRMS